VANSERFYRSTDFLVDGAQPSKLRWLEQHSDFKLNGLEIETPSSESVENSNAVGPRFPTVLVT
jgi:hypothetical protein